jgi:hypothetical protein
VMVSRRYGGFCNNRIKNMVWLLKVSKNRNSKTPLVFHFYWHHTLDMFVCLLTAIGMPSV